MDKASAKQMQRTAAPDLSRQLTVRDAELIHLRYESDLRAKRLAWMMRSRSWRMTRPLRLFAETIYRIVGRTKEHPIFPPELLKFRRRVLKEYVDLPCNCLDIAPELFSPLIYERGANVKVLDSKTTEEQRQRAEAAGRDQRQVRKVDYVCKDGHYEQVVDDRFDLVVTSYSVTGSPTVGGNQLVSHLQTLRKLLNRDGLLLIDFPDRRHSRDGFRFTTSLGHLVSEYLQKDEESAAGPALLALENGIYGQCSYNEKLRHSIKAAAPETAAYVFEHEDTVLRALLPLCAMGLLDFDLVEARMSRSLGRFAVLLRAGRRKTTWRLLEAHYDTRIYNGAAGAANSAAFYHKLDENAADYAIQCRKTLDGEEIIRLCRERPGAVRYRGIDGTIAASGTKKLSPLGSLTGLSAWQPGAAKPANPMHPANCGLVPGLVSVVLPVYNQAQLLKKSVRSVLAQTYRDIELIIINDGSEDEVEEVLRQYSDSSTQSEGKKTVQVRSYNQANQGLPKALSNGFSLARGEFWCWTSADNLMEPTMLEQLVEKLQAEPDLGMVYADYYAIDDRDELLQDRDWRPLNRPDPESGIIHLPRNTRDLNTVQDNFIGPCFLYRGWIGRLLGDYTPEIGIEDYDYWMRINTFFPVRHLGSGEPLYRYRVHDNTLSARASRFRISRKVEQLMAHEKQRAAYFASKMEVAADTVGAQYLNPAAAGEVKQRPACDRQGQLIAGVAETAELLILGSGSALTNMATLMALTTERCMAIAIIFDQEDRRCLRLRPLLSLDACIALVPDPASAARLRLFANCPLLDIRSDTAVFAAMAFARNRHFFHRSWSAEDLQRQMPQPYRRPRTHERIVLQVDDFMQGGLENVVMDLASSLREEGFDTTIAILGKRGAAADKADSLGLHIESFGGLLKGKLSPKTYLDWLKQNRTTLVNAHYSTFAAQECKEAGIPFIETIHNSYVWLPPQQIEEYRQTDDCITAYICVSATAANYADRALGLNPSKMHVIPNGIDAASLGGGNSNNGTDNPKDTNEKAIKENRKSLRQQWGVAADAPVFLNVASIMATKAQLPLVQAFATVLKEQPKARLVLLGSVMEKPYMEQVEKAVKQLGLNEHVVFAGFHLDSAPFYQAADIFVLPSYWEGWSLSLAEAAISGLYCVITDVGSAYEFVGHPRVEIVPPPFGDMTTLNHSNLHQYVYGDHPTFTEDIAKAMLRSVAARDAGGNRQFVDQELAARFDRRRAYANYADLFQQFSQR